MPSNSSGRLSIVRPVNRQFVTGPMGRIQSASWNALLILALFNRAKHGGCNDRARLASKPSVHCDVHPIGLNAIRSASRGVDSSICTTSRHARLSGIFQLLVPSCQPRKDALLTTAITKTPVFHPTDCCYLCSRHPREISVITIWSTASRYNISAAKRNPGDYLWRLYCVLFVCPSRRTLKPKEWETGGEDAQFGRRSTCLAHDWLRPRSQPQDWLVRANPPIAMHAW